MIGIPKLANLWQRSGSILSPLNSGDGITVYAGATFNSDAGDNDFTVKKNTSGDAFKYDAGNDTHTFDAPANNTLLTNTPTGTVPLAIATVDYVNNSVAGVQSFNQVGHGLSTLEAIYYDTTWQKADATNKDKLAIGVVVSVADVDNFSVTFSGPITSTAHGLTVGEYYFVDPATPGSLTSTKPTGAGEYENPLLYVVDTNTLLITPWRPSVALIRNKSNINSTPVTATTYACQEVDEFLLIDASSNNVEVTLLAPATNYDGFETTIKRIDSTLTNTVTIKSSTGNIDGTVGTTGTTITSQNNSKTFVCDATDYWVK